jgi:hypothetical protein
MLINYTIIAHVGGKLTIYMKEVSKTKFGPILIEWNQNIPLHPRTKYTLKNSLGYLKNIGYT